MTCSSDSFALFYFCPNICLFPPSPPPLSLLVFLPNFSKPHPAPRPQNSPQIPPKFPQYFPKYPPLSPNFPLTSPNFLPNFLNFLQLSPQLSPNFPPTLPHFPLFSQLSPTFPLTPSFPLIPALMVGVKIESKKLEWNVQSKVGSLDNATHTPGGGDKKVCTQRSLVTIYV